MASQQLLDILPSYISFYKQQQTISSPTVSTTNLDRTSILKWFCSLSTHQRLSHLTIVDRKFAQLLLLMLCKLGSHGQGTFFVLPDVPSHNQPHLPTLLFRKSQGLISRILESDESGRFIRDSTRLFSSDEGLNPSGHGFSPDCLDTVTFSEGFVSDMDRFVEAMDNISGLEFLRSGWGEFGSDWIELGWLKAKGYYSLEAFVANRVEVALRLAWLSCNGGKKRGVKLKERASVAAGMAANVYWRKKGCVDWWSRLEEVTRKKALLMITGKTTKSLVGGILKGAGRDLGERMWLFSSEAELPIKCNFHVSTAEMVSQKDEKFSLKESLVSNSGNSFSFDPDINGLFVLQDIIHIILAFQYNDFDKTELFFSTLNTVNTIRDCMLRKFRGLFMVVSLDSTRLELLEEEKLDISVKKTKEKKNSTIHKKKGKNRGAKKSDSTSKNSKQCCTPHILKNHGSSVVDERDIYTADSSKIAFARLGNEVDSHALPSLEETPNQRNVQKVPTAKGKVRKESNKKRTSCQRLGAATEVPNSAANVESTSSIHTIDHYGEKNPVHAPESLVVPENFLQILDSSVNRRSQSSSSCLNGTKTAEYFGDVAAKFSGSSKDSLSAQVVLKLDKENCSLGRKLDSSKMTKEVSALDSGECPQNSEAIRNKTSSYESRSGSKIEIDDSHEQKNRPLYHTDTPTSSGSLSYEWPPSVVPLNFPCLNSYYLPHATDRLHLEVGHHFKLSVSRMHQTCNSSLEVGCGRLLPRPLPLSADLPPLVGSLNGLTTPLTCNYDTGYRSNRQCAMQQGFGAQNAYFNTHASEDDRKNSSEFVNLSDRTSTQDAADEFEGQWVSEEEYEMHTMNCLDYNQYFGGGIMYWNPSDYPGAGFSRPPSLSSDDSSWAWREADMNRTVDDMVGFSTSYSTNGLASPSTAPYCSPFESLGPAQQAVTFARPVNEVNSKVMHQSSEFSDAENQEDITVDIDGNSSDSLPYPILRPIIVPNISRDRSRSEFKRNLDLRSPCVPPNRREKPRIKRPPSPVVLCVPHAPRPPPPSPVGESRKQRCFPMVRSGSSSPRNWGVRGWFHDGASFDEACVHMDGAELVWPSWGSKKIPSRQIVQPLTGALLQERLIAISQLTHDQEHPDVALPLQPPEQLNCPKRKESLLVMQNLLHGEIDSFCKKVATENLARRPYINWAVKRVTRSLQVLWPRSRTNIFGSNATGLSLPTSDVDLVVCLPPVRNLEPIKEAGILEGRNGIKETCLQHAARYLANQEWVKPDSLKTLENTMIPLIMLVVEVPCDFDPLAASIVQIPRCETVQQIGNQRNYQQESTSPDHFSPNCSRFSHNRKGTTSVRLDISFKSPSHTGLQTAKLVQQLTEQFPAAVPLALVLKKFLADRSLDQAYSGGLSSYCLVLLIIRFLQHEHHLGRAINQNLGKLLIDFLYFFGNVFDPRQMRVSVQGSGVYVNRERGYSIDPIYIDDPLFPANNVGKNCFRIHQCIKAFADAYATLESELCCITNDDDVVAKPQYQLLQKLIPSISLL